MIRISSLTLKNFLSIGNITQSLNLDHSGLTLVLGENSDNAGSITRNGAGKTTILQAISYALYGKPLTKIKIPNLVNNINNKGMLVTLDFTRDGRAYRIERGQKPAVLRFFVDSTEVKDDQAQGENRHTQEEIERLIGMSHTLFKHVLALNTFSEPFLKMTVSDQRAIIEELLGVMQISQRAEILKKLMNGPDGTKEKIRDSEAEIKATTEANNRIETAIRLALQNSMNWENQLNKSIKNLNDEINAIRNIDYDAELRLFDQLESFDIKTRDLVSVIEGGQKEINLLEREHQQLLYNSNRYLKEANDAEPTLILNRLKSDIQRKEKDIERHLLQIDKLKEELSVINYDLEHSNEHTCRTCGQGLSGTDHLQTVISNLEKQKLMLSKKITREENEIQRIKTETETLKKHIEDEIASSSDKVLHLTKEANALKEKADLLSFKIKDHRSALELTEQEISLLGGRPVSVFSSRDELYKAKQLFEMLLRDLEKEKEKTNPFRDQINSLKSTIQIIDLEPLNELNTLYKHQDFLMRLLTSKDSFIRKKIIDQNLAYLNHRVNYYLDKLGLPHEVCFISDLSVEITLLGRDFDFEQLSRGEMNRVIMATSLSFRDVWESLNTSINLLWVDELFDTGLDSQGVEAGVGILKNIVRDRGKSVFLISHKDDLQSQIDSILIIKKEEGFSSISLRG